MNQHIYDYGRIYDPSGDSIGLVLSDETGCHAAFVLEHPDDGPVVVAIPQDPGHGAPCWSVHQCRDVDDAARCLSRHFGTDARPDDAAPARCLVATVEWTMRCCECRDEWVHTEHIRAGCEIRPEDDACPNGCLLGDTYVCTPRLVNVCSERATDA